MFVYLTIAVYNIPVDSFIKEAMMAIFGEDGVLEKGGFYMDGYIKKDGTAFIKMISGFGNRTNLINEVRSLLSLAFVLYNNALRHVDNLLRHVDNLLRHVDNVLRHLAQGITSGSAMYYVILPIYYFM